MNPEFRRNLWLEFSLHRLIAAPVVIALVLVLVAAASKKDWMENLSGVSAWGFGLAVLLWGTQLAGGSVSAEARERTWDTQRMSAIGPWAMTWGKLLGAPAFAWYVGLLLLPVFVICGTARPELPVWRLALTLVAGALMLHAAALTGSIYAARKGFHRRASGILVFIALLLFVLVPGMRYVDNFERSMTWWHMPLSTVNFVLVSILVFAAWAVLGAYRSMCTALEIRTRPWALPVFCAFTATWFNGFFQQGKPNEFGAVFGALFCAVVIGSAFCYALLLAEPGGASSWQRLRVRLRTRNLRRVLEETPLWLVALLTGLVCSIIAMLTDTGNPKASNLTPFAAMLFVVRDAAIFQFFALAREPRRAEAAALFYLLLLYGLLPGLLHAMSADGVAQLILPMVFTNSAAGTAIMLVQAGIASAAAWWRWKSIHAPDTDAKIIHKNQ